MQATRFRSCRPGLQLLQIPVFAYMFVFKPCPEAFRPIKNVASLELLRLDWNIAFAADDGLSD